jgi:RNA polymerase sigma factor (sigma-70 family)
MPRGSSSTVLWHVHTLFRVGAVGGLSDEQLLQRFLDGSHEDSETAFGVLVERHGPMVLGVCRGVLRNPHDAADAFQATFLVLARRVSSIRNRDALGHWLYGVARRVAVRAKVVASRRLIHERQAAEASEACYRACDDRNEDFAALHDEIARLPAKYRVPLILCYLEGMSYEMAASSLRLTEDTVRGRLARARKLLGTRLTRRGLALGTGLLATAFSGKAPAAVPAALATMTIQAAVKTVANPAATGGAVAVLTEGVLRSMLMTKIRWISSAFLTTGALAAGAVVYAQQDTEARPRPLEVDRAVQPGPQLPIIAASPTSPRGQGEKLEPEEQLAEMVLGRIVRSSAINKDCMVLAYLPDWAHGEVDNIAVANNDGGVRTLLSWPDVDSEDGSSDLHYVVALYSRKTTAGGTAGPILAFELRESWTERTSWQTMPDYDPEPVASFKFSPGDGWKLFDVTSVVQAQAKSGRKNKGVLLRFLSEDRSAKKNNWSGHAFVSREGEGEWAGRTPLLLVVKPAKK